MLRFGVTIPNNWGIADPRQVLVMGPLAEALGYDSVWVMNEFVFRFNRRNTPMAAFQTLLGISTQRAPLTLPELVNRSQP